MGSKLIWIAAAFAYGALCAAIYILLSRRTGRKNPLRKAAISFAGFTAFGLVIVYILWLIFAI